MIKLEPGNVLLKPSQRRQVMTGLRRSSRLGDRLGNFDLKISMQRSGKFYELRANGHAAASDFGCRSRRHDWQTALRELTADITRHLHELCLNRAAVA
jgi:hypothetical protein